MEDDPGLSDTKALRLFPLPGVVLFPNAVLPLHIFEPRYKEMTEDAIASNRLVTIVMVRSESGGSKPKGPPALEEYGCVGRILKYERLPDGRFNFLLLGLRRVRLVREVPSGKMYRTAEAEVVEDLVDENEAVAAQAAELVELFRRFLAPIGGVDPDLEEILGADVPAGTLTDILAHALPMPPTTKQDLLAERQVELRLDTLTSWLRDAIRHASKAGSPGHFPPPFSSN